MNTRSMGDQDGLAWQADDALDVVRIWLGRCAEDHHVATLRTAEDILRRPLVGGGQHLRERGALDVEIRGAVDHQRLPALEVGLHAGALDAEVLDHRANPEDQQAR